MAKHYHIQKQQRTRDGKRIIVEHSHSLRGINGHLIGRDDKGWHEHDGLRGFARTRAAAEALANRFDEQMRAYFGRLNTRNQ